ncbi:hypothetical protein HYZ97_00420 [Candidatus Pacearchaeota archaeon]|nr:hypothetical protein [Candidatus Pacearchaeota archaeon]
MNKEALSKDEVAQVSSISLTLATYNDIFSSFDPRQYLQRALSDDFLQEIRRASRDKTSGAVELRFLMPAAKRSYNDEVLIRRRLREHFKKHYLEALHEYRRTLGNGIFMALLGMAFIIIATSIATFSPESFFHHLLVVILEPAGWFTAWTGLDQLFYTAREKKPYLDFYEKMSNGEVVFLSY